MSNRSPAAEIDDYRTNDEIAKELAAKVAMAKQPASTTFAAASQRARVDALEEAAKIADLVAAIAVAAAGGLSFGELHEQVTIADTAEGIASAIRALGKETGQ